MTSPDEPRPLTLWKEMDEASRLDASRAFWQDEQSFAEQAEVVGLLARQMNFRPKSILALPLDKKARYLARMTRLSDVVAARLLVAHHLASKRPMMASFLDRLGIAHEDGLIADEQPKAIEPAAVSDAATALFDAFPAEDVRRYFSTLLVQDPDTWAPLARVLEERRAAPSE